MDYKKEIFLEILNNLNKIDALTSIFNFLAKEIPFDHIVCYSVHRKEKQMTLFLEYGKEVELAKIGFSLEPLIPQKYYKEVMEKATKEVLVTNTKASNKMKNFTDQLLYPFSSYAYFIFDYNKSEEKFLLLAITSKHENNFTAEHKELLNEVRPVLLTILSQLYQDSPESYEFISPKGNLPQNYHEQLKMCHDLKKIVKTIELLATYDTTVLIRGNTGTGKELVASTLHTLSNRKAKPFVAVNCAAIPESLLESELFGYEKGAFTGAVQMKKGFFEQAEGGTIFLDEVGELSLNAQARLLRVLESKKIQRVGSEKVINLNIRIIAATHRNLLAMVEEKTFREDLYYRLNIISIEIPTLEQRKKDIRTLAEYFYIYYTKKMHIAEPPVFTNKSMRFLLDYSWPGNVRELRSSIEKGIINAVLEQKEELDFSFLPANKPTQTQLKNLTDDEIYKALETSKWRIQGSNGAAKILGVPPSSLRSRMRASHIPFKKSLHDDKT